MKKTRKFIIFASSVMVTWLALCGAIGVVAVEGTLHPVRRALTMDDENRAFDLAVRNTAHISDVEIAARDGARLRAWSIRPVAGNGAVVILEHGQGDNRAGMMGPAEMLLRHGYTVLLPDARAHGSSGGDFGTYGILESDDTRRWFEWLRVNGTTGCIDGLGDSMGGAEVLESLTTEKNFCAVIAESSFATFQEAAYDRLGQQFSAGAWLGRTLLRPALFDGIYYARMRYGIDLRRADPAAAVAATRVPVLLIHGLADTNLPPRHSEMIRVGNAAVVLWEPAGADHCGASTTAPVEYERRVTGWFDSHNHN
jgi:uncharacterized protein